MKNPSRDSIILLFAVLCLSCSVKKYLPAGEKLYDGAVVEMELAPGVKEKKSSLIKPLEDLVKPKRNKMFLGNPNKLWRWYAIGASKEEKGFKHWLREKTGEPPVLSSSVDLHVNTQNMQDIFRLEIVIAFIL